MRAYVSTTTKGLAKSQNENEIVVSLYGPQGGLRACEALTFANAAALRDQLTTTLREVGHE
jgi:hypothetical protein